MECSIPPPPLNLQELKTTCSLIISPMNACQNFQIVWHDDTMRTNLNSLIINYGMLRQAKFSVT
jgi:hypothetical protein